MPGRRPFWSPLLLSEVKGQDDAVGYLRRVIDRKLSAPLLLIGEEGVGRRFSIMQAAKEHFADEEIHNPRIDREAHPDVLVLRPPAGKDIGIDTVRSMITSVYDFPLMAPLRYVVIDGAHRMTTAAANAFLKTLEEPPEVTQFFLLSPSAASILPTIRSRCGVIRYNHLSESFIVDHLVKHGADSAKALVYARLAEGSVGRAVQYWGSGRLDLRDRAFNLLKTGLGGDLSSLFLGVDSFKDDLKLALHFLDLLLRDLIMIQHDPARLTNIDIADELAEVGRLIGESRIQSLVRGLQTIRGRMHVKINLTFHVKACLASVF